MKAKLLLCFLLGQTLMAYAAAGSDRPTTLKSYFERLKSLVSRTEADKPVNINPSLVAAGQVCRSYSSLGITASMLWSDNNTWTTLGTPKPVAGSAVTIPANAHIILDESPPSLASLTINGKLEFARQDLNLTAGWIMVMGTLEVGTPASPFTNKATITLNATDMNGDAMGMGMGTRGILVMGGKIDLHGVPPTKHYTKLNDHASKGATNLSLLEAVNWNVSDQVVVAATDYYGAGGGTAQRTQITAVNSASLTIQDGLNAQRWGKLQYLTKDGMSLTPGTLPAGILEGTPTVLDERAEVANLTRNIVVQSPDDDLWQNSGFGCHIMVMKMDLVPGEARLNGVEIKRGGQAGKLGRYPFHWHMLSYEVAQTLPDVTNQYLRNSVINQSSQRGIVIHGTNGAEVKNNVVYDVRGHGVFMEDAVERRNIIDGNIVMKVRNPSKANALKLHETDIHEFSGSSGYWITNPDNTITNNVATDCEKFGLWLAFPTRTFGASVDIPLVPRYMVTLVFRNNVGHSNYAQGIFMDQSEIDEEGHTETSKYAPTTNMKEPTFGNDPGENGLEWEFTDNSSWKNNTGGFWLAAYLGRNRRAVCADNTSTFFSGKTDTVYPSIIEQALAVSTSLNYNMNGVTRPTVWGIGENVAFASYHSTADVKNNVVVNFQPVEGASSGFFNLSDYYITPVDKGNVRNTGNILINTHPGVRYQVAPHIALAVLWDHHNYCGGPANQDNYYVYNTPFFTYGQTPHIVPPGPDISGAVIVEGPFYGFWASPINGFERPYEKIVVTRTNTAGATVGNWVVENSHPSVPLPNFHHFAAHPSGYYYLDFPTIDDVNSFALGVTNMLTDKDYQVLAVEYSGNYTITKFFAHAPGYPPKPYASVADFQAVVNAPTGEVYWQDKTNNKVWMKVRGGVQPGHPELADNHDLNLYKMFSLYAEGTYTSANPGYKVSFTVKGASGAPVAGATVDLRGNIAVSDANGVATFTHISPGTNMLYLATKDGYNNATGTLNVAAADVAKNITLSAVGSPAYTVTFTVKDASGKIVEGITVTFNGQAQTSRFDGLAVFNNVAPGTNLPYSAARVPLGASGSINVSSADVAQTIVLSASSSPAPTYAVTFNIKDAANALVSGASVTFNGQTVGSNASGIASFTNVAAGTNLPYTATKTGFNTSTGAVSVTSANVTQNIVLGTVSSPAPTYAVTFTVKDAANALVSGASVTFRGQTIASNASGVATFTNVAPGSNLAYNASKTGFNAATGSVNVVSANVAHNIVLSAVGSPTYTVTFTVKDATEALVSGASVTFNGQTIASNANGVATFTNVAAGANLVYSATKTGFNNASGVVSVAANLAHNILLSALGSPVYTVSFTVKDASEALLADALVSFNGETMTTTASGEVVFNNVAPGSDLPYSVSKTGFDEATGALSVAAANVTQNVVLSPSTVVEPMPEPEPTPEPEPNPELVTQLNARNIFSPNGDGVNELWEVEGIEQQPELQVLIFNGYGQRVYQAQPYTNSWDGGGLPDGVYYFQVQNQEGKPVKKGAITIVR